MDRTTATLTLVIAVMLTAATRAVPVARATRSGEELMVVPGEVGRRGGELVVAARAEPKTFNPLVASDGPSRELIWRTAADLIHINRETQQTEPALASSWTVSPDGLRYTLRLRREIRFSDGHPFDADDVMFSFGAYLDERVHSPQRDLLVVGGKPVCVGKIDQYTVTFEFAAPYAAAERLFDNIAMLPRHLLESRWKNGRIAEAWGIATPPAEIAGLGPFRLEQYRPGEQAALVRNPYYWKTDTATTRLPYLDRLTFVFVPSEEAQVIRLRSGELDVLNRVNPQNIAALERDQHTRRYLVQDLGPGLEYNFLFFNLNDPPESPVRQARWGGEVPQDLRAKRAWFGDDRFRRAISLALDRASLVRLVYHGRATPLWGHVTPGNRLWVNANVPRPPRSEIGASALLKEAGFSRREDQTLVDKTGNPVTFTILVAAGNEPLTAMGTIIQEDLRRIGIRVQIVPLEFGALLNRVLETHDYDACLLRLAGGDVDPNPEMNVWLSSGQTHLWRPAQAAPATPWEAEIDRLMRQQVTTLGAAERKRLYDQVQALVADKLPLVPLVSPNIVVAAKRGLGNFRPAILEHYTLWNVEQLFWVAAARGVSE
jgi:peptide/nickel transport system substrate-binding protein